MTYFPASEHCVNKGNKSLRQHQKVKGKSLSDHSFSPLPKACLTFRFSRNFNSPFDSSPSISWTGQKSFLDSQPSSKDLEYCPILFSGFSALKRFGILPPCFSKVRICNSAEYEVMSKRKQHQMCPFISCLLTTV